MMYGSNERINIPHASATSAFSNEKKPISSPTRPNEIRHVISL